MKKDLSRVLQSRLLVVLTLASLISTPHFLSAGGSSDGVKGEKLSFDKRLELYLDQKSRQFIAEMTMNEKTLSQFEQNVRRELHERRISEVPVDLGQRYNTDEFQKLSGVLLKEYSAELTQLLQIAREIEGLEDLASQFDDAKSHEGLASLRQQLFSLLEESQAYSTKQLGTSELAGMNDAEHTRRNAALSLRIRLNEIANSTRSVSDRKLLAELSKRVSALSSSVQASDDRQVHAIAKSYIYEVSLLVDILESIEDLNQDARQRHLDVADEVKTLRNTIISNLDQTLQSIVGYEASIAAGGPTVSEIFYQWKAAEFAKHQLRVAAYQIRKNWLLKNGTLEERERMLQRDLRTSFANFISNEFGVARRQFDLILQDYGQSFDEAATVHYYRAESYYERQLYDSAGKDYDKIVADYANTEYLGDSLYRLMYIHDLKGSRADFVKYFQQLEAHAAKIDQETVSKCKYLAAYHNTRAGQYKEAEEILAGIGVESRFFPRAHFLLGMVQVNQGNYASAIEIFKSLISTSQPETGNPEFAKLRNDALVKLGFLYYQKGEYEEATKYFDQVTANHIDRDQGLVASAWSSFKVGDLAGTTAKVDLLLGEEMESAYTYEALVLAAHCKRILQDDSALDDLRYVANARRVSGLSSEYNRERRELVDQLALLDKLEERILENRNERLYRVTADLRSQLELTLARFPYSGSSGTIVLEELQAERQEIVQQIGELDTFVSKAYEIGDDQNVSSANQQRQRLMRSLDQYTADAEVKNVNSFLDYPLATKEGAEQFRIAMIRGLQAEIEAQRQMLQEHIDQAQALRSYCQGQQLDDITTQIDLEVVEQDLKVLDSQFSQLVADLGERQVPDTDATFDRWAEFSGFGMSDRTYNGYRAKEAEIAQVAYKYNTITTFLEARRGELERRVVGIEKDVKELEFQMKQESLASQRKHRDEYFRDSYFDSKERENQDE